MTRFHKMTALTLLLSAVTASADFSLKLKFANVSEQTGILVNCTIVDEGPLACGEAVLKSYKVRIEKRILIPDSINIPDTIWVHYDSQEYVGEIRSGLEDRLHLGSRLYAMLEWKAELEGREFRIVRLELAGREEK